MKVNKYNSVKEEVGGECSECGYGYAMVSVVSVSVVVSVWWSD